MGTSLYEVSTGAGKEAPRTEGKLEAPSAGGSVVPHLPNSDAPLPPTLGGISPLLYPLKFVLGLYDITTSTFRCFYG